MKYDWSQPFWTLDGNCWSCGINIIKIAKTATGETTHLQYQDIIREATIYKLDYTDDNRYAIDSMHDDLYVAILYLGCRGFLVARDKLSWKKYVDKLNNQHRD